MNQHNLTLSIRSLVGKILLSALMTFCKYNSYKTFCCVIHTYRQNVHFLFLWCWTVSCSMWLWSANSLSMHHLGTRLNEQCLYLSGIDWFRCDQLPRRTLCVNFNMLSTSLLANWLMEKTLLRQTKK